MKLSKRTLETLKNFATLNPGLYVRPGRELSTIAPSKKVIAYATVEEEFPREFGVYEMSRLLGTLSMFGDPEVEFGERSLVVTGDGKRAEYVYSAENTVVKPPETRLELPSSDVTVSLPARGLSDALKAASVLGAPNIELTGDGRVVRLSAVDSKNPSSHAFSVELGEHEVDFRLVFRVETFRFIPGDYVIEASLQKIAKFTQGSWLTYFVAAEAAEAR